MELGHYQQSFVSLMLIVVAAIVALICDLLKRHNEQLRELTIELDVRREEDQRRSQWLTPRSAEPVEYSKTEVPEPPAVPEAAASKRPIGAKDTAVAKEKKRTVSAGALAAMERGAALAISGGRPRSAPIAAPVAEPAELEVIAEPEVISEPQVVSEPHVIVQQEIVEPPVKTPAKTDWGSLLSRNTVPKVRPKPKEAIAEPSLPAGFQDGFVLAKLAQSRRPISGLVVSIGVNATRNAAGALPEQVTNLVHSLIGPGDFAAQSSEDEFLLIYPREHGASAQRRLSHIAQQLWDFQLRSLGSFQILFSWGGVEVQSESLEEAIASASERMQETKRGRKLLTMASPAPAASVPLRQTG